MRRALLLGAALAVVVACQGGTYFTCKDDDGCAAQGGVGTCQPTGACSFPDDACASGQRYGDASEPGLAGQCVVLDGTSTGEPEPDTSTGSTTTAPEPADDTGEGCPPDWWDCAWAHRHRLSLVAPPAGPLEDVPVLVLLASGRVDHGRMQADGEDVRLVSASGVVLSYEIERWDPAAVSSVWTRVDELGGTADHLWLYYGNPVAEGAQEPAAVWADPYAGVWHLEGEPLDASAHGNHASPAGPTSPVPGHVADGRDILGSNARLDVPMSPSLDDVFASGGTVSAWIRLRSFGGGGFGRIANKDDGTAGWIFYAGTGGRLRFHAGYGGGPTTLWETDDGAVELHRWVHVAVVADLLGAAPPLLYVDGAPVELLEPAAAPVVDVLPTDAKAPLVLGNRVMGDRRLDGILDEVRIETVARDAEWIRVQHDAMRDALLEYGPLESWASGS